jgi:hypothetical protein
MTPPRRRPRALWLLVPALLTVVAVGQHVLATASTLSPWKGGGFGMFSTVDAPVARFVRAHVVAGSVEYAVDPPAALAARVRIIRAWPRPGNVDDLARRLARLRWTAADFGHAVPTAAPIGGREPSADEEPSEPLAVESVRVAVWRYRFDPAGPGLEAETILETTVAVGEER